MNKTVLYGSACNPPHLTHHAILKDLKKHFSDVWFMPCYQHMFGKEMLSVEHRLNMAKIVSKVEDVNLCTFEIESKKKNSTWDTLQNFKSLYPDREFIVAIGTDNLYNFKQWDHWEELAENYCFVAYKRNIVEKEYLKIFKNIFILDYGNDVPNTSSSAIRNFICSDKDYLVNDLLHPEVLSYIQENNLYKKE